MATKFDLQLVINAKNNAEAAFNSLNRQMKNTNVMSKETAKNMKRIGIAAGAMGLAIGKKAADAAMMFEKSMQNVATLVDTNTESMEDMKKEILDMGNRVPVALDELTGSLYDIRSAGVEASGAMDVLENSARLAVGGLGSTQEATDLMTSSLNAFGLNAAKSGKVADVLFKAVKNGKTTVTALAQGFGQVAPSANAMGVEFEELMAITSGMTTSGLQASVAYTQIRAAMTNLQKPTKEMQEVLTKLNITSIKSQVENNGLANTLRLLANEAGGNEQQLAKMFGSAEALNAVLMLMGSTGEQVTGIYSDMKTGANALNDAVKKQNEAYAAQYQILKNQLNTQLIQLGVKILPLVSKGLKNGILIAGEWIVWFNKVADVLGTLIYKYERLIIKAAEWYKASMRYSIPGGFGGGGGMSFDSGGVVPGPKGAAQLAVVHGGETILPTHKDSSAKRVGSSVNIYVTGNTLLDQSAGEIIGKQIVDELSNNMRL